MIVESVWFPRQNGSEIKPEAVYAGLLGPESQTIRDHLDDSSVAEVQSVAGTGVVDVIAWIIGQQTIVRCVINSLERERGSAFVSFGGVVVDHVHNDFDPSLVKARDHFLELAEWVSGLGRIARIGGKEPDTVVAPVVGEAFFQQVAVIDKEMDRQQLNRSDAQLLDVAGPRLLPPGPRRCRAGALAFRGKVW